MGQRCLKGLLMTIKYTFPAVLSLIVVAACAELTVPVAAIDNRGHIVKGTATAKPDGHGMYTLSDGKITCTGNYNAYDLSQTIPLSILCDNGMTGIGSATRTADGRSGSGTFTTSDGRQWRFVFGENATALF